MEHSRKTLKAATTPKRVGHQTLFTGDCLEVLGALKESSVDVVVTSPPYNLNLSYGVYNDRRQENEYLDWLVAVSKAIKRTMAPDASFFLNIAGSSSQPWAPFELITRLRDFFVLQNHIVWVKSIGIGTESSGHFKPISGHRFTHHNHEHIFHLTGSGNVSLDRLSIGLPFADKTNIARWGHKRDLRCRGNTWFIPYKTVRSRAQKHYHPGTFPVELPLWCIYLHGKRPAVVLDPFLGAGTTLVAAQMAGATGFGIDIDHGYVATAVARVLQTVEGAVDVTLTENEIEELLKQDPSTAKDGGFQSLLVKLQGKLNRTTGFIHLDDDDLTRIPQYAFKYGNGGWETRLKAIFERTLGSSLNRP